ncbi:hypothetical protein FXO38_04722 [Capsicum annuum]|nr:hypothetical protein FXO38_04722 [Capsicum annuum]
MGKELKDIKLGVQVLDRGKKIELLVDKTDNLRSQFVQYFAITDQGCGAVVSTPLPLATGLEFEFLV